MNFIQRSIAAHALVFFTYFIWNQTISRDAEWVIPALMVLAVIIIIAYFYIKRTEYSFELLNASYEGPQMILFSYVVILLGLSVNSGDGVLGNFSSESTTFIFFGNFIACVAVTMALADAYYDNNKDKKNAAILSYLALYLLCNFLSGVLFSFNIF